MRERNGGSWLSWNSDERWCSEVVVCSKASAISSWCGQCSFHWHGGAVPATSLVPSSSGVLERIYSGQNVSCWQHLAGLPAWFALSCVWVVNRRAELCQRPPKFPQTMWRIPERLLNLVIWGLWRARKPPPFMYRVLGLPGRLRMVVCQGWATWCWSCAKVYQLEQVIRSKNAVQELSTVGNVMSFTSPGGWRHGCTQSENQESLVEVVVCCWKV